jgi:hypothetical protein
MPTFFGRRYERKSEAVGNTEKALGILILLLVAAVLVAFAVQVATNRDYLFDVAEDANMPSTPQATGVRAEAVSQPAVRAPPLRTGFKGEPSVFPAPGIEAWRAPSRVERFAADDLYVKIDGRAETYLQFGVVGLSFGTYQHAGDPARMIDVYWYDMGEAANAAAIYQSEKPPDCPTVSIGDAGYQVGGAVFFCEGSSYVQVLPGSLDEADADVALTIAQRIARRINDNDE